MEPKWLDWAKRLQAIAQNGLTFAEGHFDVERYEQVRQIAAEILAEGRRVARILERDAPRLLALEYLGSPVRFRSVRAARPGGQGLGGARPRGEAVAVAAGRGALTRSPT